MLTHPACVSNDRELVIRVCVWGGLSWSGNSKCPLQTPQSAGVFSGGDPGSRGALGGKTRVRWPHTAEISRSPFPGSAPSSLTQAPLDRVSPDLRSIPTCAGECWGEAGTCSERNSRTLSPCVGTVVQSSIYFWVFNSSDHFSVLPSFFSVLDIYPRFRCPSLI